MELKLTKEQARDLCTLIHTLIQEIQSTSQRLGTLVTRLADALDEAQAADLESGEDNVVTIIVEDK